MKGIPIIRHIAPLGWEHIILTGDYIWSFEPPETPDGYRQLRDPDVNLLAA
ncbi:MAG: transposase [bacterium]|nr:transposase [bacterium]